MSSITYRLSNRLRNSQQNSRTKRIKGFTLIEMAVVVAVVGVLSASVFALSSTMVGMHASIAEERFKTVVQSVLNAYYLDNIRTDATTPQLIGSAAPGAFSIAATAFNEYKLVGAGDVDFSHDGAGNRWYYVGCSTGGDVEHPQIVNTPNAANPNALFYCDIIGYTTNNNTAIALGTLGGRDIQDWEDGVDGTGPLSAVSDFVVVRGAPIISQIVNDSWGDLARTRAAMEQYYVTQQHKNRELGVRVSRFANAPINVANADLYDFESIFSNTNGALDVEMDPVIAYGLRLTDEDVSNAFGDMLIDNSSNNVRHPENPVVAQSRPPYTARIWYQLCKNPDCVTNDDVIIEAIASSGSP